MEVVGADADLDPIELDEDKVKNAISLRIVLLIFESLGRIESKREVQIPMTDL